MPSSQVLSWAEHEGALSESLIIERRRDQKLGNYLGLNAVRERSGFPGRNSPVPHGE